MERQSAEQYGCLFRHTCLGLGRRRNRQGGFRTARAASAAEEAVSGAAGNRTYTGARRGHARRGSHRLPVGSWVGETDAGLHSAPAATGACSADMMLEALVACAGMTVSAVATAMRKAPGRAGC
jgi:hypothetical protein